MKATQKVITFILGLLGIGLFGAVLAGGELSLSASADSIPYQDTTDVEFTFYPTLEVKLGSTELTVSGLTQKNKADSSALSIAVKTNDASGYTLYATVGDTNNRSKDLRLNGSDTTNKFTMLASAGALPTSGAVGYWGYKTSASATTYNPIALYTDTTVTTVNSSTTSTDGSTTGVTNFYIGAYAGESQASGDYTNVINFSVVTNTPASS